MSLEDNDLDSMPDRIAETFAGLTLLVTGGTGFMGKVLVEKLLRKCPDITKIMLLVRPKKGKSPKQRLEEMLNDELFAKVRNLRGGVEPLLEKLQIVCGDVSAPDLAISNEDKMNIIQNVHIVLHAAATIRFDEELKKAVFLNVRGTKLIIELAKQCKKLKLFIHISTAYCHLHEKLLEEKPYPPPADPHKIIEAMEWMTDDAVSTITPTLLSKLPNSYAFTKALGEALAVEAMEHIPVIVLRPSIVIPVWQDPVPGWTDNINGPTGLLIGAGKGVIRTMYCKSNSYADYLPVDVFINGIMICVWNYIKMGETKSNVINFTSSAEIKVTWLEMIDAGREIIMNRVPLNGVVCLMRVHRRISKGFEVFEYYTNNQWDFKSDIAQTVRQKLNPRERRDYKVDAIGLDISKYFEDCIRAARIFILKESDDTLPAARRHMKIMWFVDIVAQLLFWSLMLYWFSGWMSSFYSFLVGSSNITPEAMVE
ncbi:unnamed protein product [Danaus chrysippus]|uniref:Fatty acyl-CoA reductase n=1 Tax=Danaus chrysippus TaxID=151541 RepID=A0A8J2R3N8_9NEOP|nr:unnamed protein product [Danaus chrysippus]